MATWLETDYCIVGGRLLERGKVLAAVPDVIDHVTSVPPLAPHPERGGCEYSEATIGQSDSDQLSVWGHVD